MTNPYTSTGQEIPAPAGASATRPSGWAQMFAAFAESDASGYRHLLVLRFAVINLVAFALVGAAWLKGWVAAVFEGDTTQLVALIGIVFLAGLFECGRRIACTSTELDQIRMAHQAPSRRVQGYLQAVRGREPQGRAIAGSTLKLMLTARIAPIRHTANSLVFLGLIGTVIGFIIALSGVDPEAAADVGSVGPMVSTLISGMSVALYTTLVGAILNVWLMVNYRVLEGGTIRLLSAILELGERREQS